MPVPAILPFLPMIGQALGSGIKAIGASRAAKREGEFYGNLKERGESEAKKAQKARDSYGLGSTYRKYLDMAMQDPTADLRRQQEERRQASNLGALQSGGARALLGGLQAQSQGAADRMNQISADEAARRASAFSTVGQAEQRVLENKARFADRDLMSARSLAGQGLAGQFRASQARKQVGNDLLIGGVEALGQAAGAGLFGTGGGGSMNAVDGFNNATPAEQAFFMDPENQAMMSSLSSFMKEGGKVEKTPGEFSHESNPIDIMQEGAKIGEMTGGEYVINPEQARKIAQQSKFASQLFKKFDKKSS